MNGRSSRLAQLLGSGFGGFGLAMWWTCIAFALTVMVPATALGATQSVQLRAGASFKKKLHKGVHLGVAPEVRFYGVNPDRYLLTLELSYKPIKYFSTEVSWRGDLEEKRRGLGSAQRPGAALLGHLPMGDFKLSARFFYTYTFGYLQRESHRLRYKAELQYDIPHAPVDLEIYAEAFQELSAVGWFKMRYGGQGTVKFFNTKKLDQFLYAGYALDYYLDVRLNVHIVEFGYRLKF